MSEQYDYIIVGGGLAGASAVKGIRMHDKTGSIALFSSEKHLPYNRPPLSKKLWNGQEKIENVYIRDAEYYKKNNVELFLSDEVNSVNSSGKTITGYNGKTCSYGKLLIATGGEPRTLENADDDIVHYYRTLDDYYQLEKVSRDKDRFLFLGGSFIGAELSAAMAMNNKNVSVVFPEKYLLQRILPEDLALFVTDYYKNKGVDLINNDTVESFSLEHDVVSARTKDGRLVVADYVIAGLGINLNTKLARTAGLETGNGIITDQYLRTSNPDIYAAGDLANFPSTYLDKRIRLEHEDNSKIMGVYAGENMAGANKPYDYMPYFYSDLFDLGFEAVGDLNSGLATYSHWVEPYREGVVYYFENRLLRGVLLWNVWEKVDAARELIKKKIQYENIESIRESGILG